MVNGRAIRIPPASMNNMELSTLIHHYEVHNRTEGKSERTVEWCNLALDLFLGWREGR